MRKQELLYATALLAWVVGIWRILIAGQHLHAPYHLAGRWAPSDGAGTGAAAAPFTLAQSGRFLHLRWDDGSNLDMRWQGESDRQGVHQISLMGEGQRIDIDVDHPGSPPESRLYRFKFEGRVQGSWSATRQPAEDRVPTPAATRTH